MLAASSTNHVGCQKRWQRLERQRRRFRLRYSKAPHFKHFRTSGKHNRSGALANAKLKAIKMNHTLSQK